MEEKSFKKGIIQSFLQNFTGEGLNAVSSILSGYFFALFLGPAVYGIWQTARVFLGYSTFTSLGIPFVMRRDFIALRAEGNIEEANKMAHVSMSYNFIINPIIALIIIAIAIISKSEIAFKASLVLVGLMYVTELFSGIGNIIHKGFNDYKTLAQGQVINSIGLLLLIPIVYYNGYYSLLIGYLFLSIIKSVFFYVKRPLEYKWAWDLPLLKKMIFTAFPIFLVTITATLFTSIDRLLIASLLDFKNVGLYSLSSFIAQPITLLVSSFSIVLFTHLNQRYGKSKEPDVINKHVYIPQKFFSRLLPPIIGVGVIIIPFFTEIFLPKYTGGIMAAQINVFAILFIKLAGFSSNGLFVLDKQKYTALSFFIAGCIKTTGSFFALKVGFGIESVAVFTLIAYFSFNTMQLYHINKSLNNGIKTFYKKLASGIICPFTILVFCILYVTFQKHLFNYLNINDNFIQMMIGVSLVLILSTRFLYITYTDLKTFLKK